MEMKQMLIDSSSLGEAEFLSCIIILSTFLSQPASPYHFCLQATESTNRKKVISKMKFSSSESLVITAYFIEMELSEFVVEGVFWVDFKLLSSSWHLTENS